MGEGKSEASVGELLSELAHDTGLLVRQEVRLASAEAMVKAKVLARNTALIGIGGALSHAGFLALLFGIIIALGSTFPLWVTALALGIVTMVVGYVLVHKGLNALSHLDTMPGQTINTLKDNLAWAKEQLR